MATIFVDESALDGDETSAGIVGSQPNLDLETATGQLELSDPSIDRSSVTFTLIGPKSGPYGEIFLDEDGTYVYNLFFPVSDDPGSGTEGRDIVVAAETYFWEAVFYDQIENAFIVIDSGTITIDIRDDISVAVDDSDSVELGSSTSGNVLSNDIPGADGLLGIVGVRLANGDLDSPASGNLGDPIEGLYGILVVGDDGSYTYEPYASLPPGNYEDVFAYTIQDSFEDLDTGALVFAIGPSANTPAQANDDSFVGVQDETVFILTSELLANDFGAPPVIVGTVTGATGGTVTLGDGVVTFEPTPGFTGTASFVYSIVDANDNVDRAVVSILFESANLPLVAIDDSFVGAENETIFISFSQLLANDISEASIAVTDAFNATDGSLTLLPTGIAFIPNANFEGVATFEYLVTDSFGATDVGLVSIDFIPQNEPPFAFDDTFDGVEDQPLEIALSALLSNDLDPDGDPLTITDIFGATNGSFTLSGDTVTFTPDADFDGIATFQYEISDPDGETDIGTVRIDFAPRNDPPFAFDDTFDGVEDEPIEIALSELLANDTDPDGDALTITDIFGATNGSFTLSGETLTFTPDADFDGVATFRYEISDPDGETDIATVRIDFAPVNDPPLAVDDAYDAVEDQPLDIPVIALLANDSDPDGDALVVTGVSGAQNGTVSLAGGTVTFTPDADFNGIATFDYTISDGNGGTDSATVSLDIGAVNDPPTFAIRKLLLLVTQPSRTFEVDPEDVDGDTLTLVTTQPANGTATVGDDDTITVQPEPDFTGVNEITVSASDGQASAEATVVLLTLSRPVVEAPVETVFFA